MSSPFFLDLRDDLGPHLIDKTKLIENIVVNNSVKGHVGVVLREIDHAANAQVTSLAYIQSLLKRFDEIFFLHPSK
jgi:hypothetical protein